MTQHKTIDWALSIALANNKPQVAEELLAMFIEALPTFQEDIHNAYQQHAIKQLHQHIHKLHGGACYVGVPNLKALAVAIETAIKRNKIDKLDSMVAGLLAEMTAILTEYKQQNFRWA